MKATTRYSIILIGLITFILVAPFLIFYVSGIKINLQKRNAVQTGIFDAKSNPSGILLKVNGAEQGKTPATVRFLTPGEYEFALQKDGYFDWKKRLAIKPDGVTFAQVGVDEVQLIKKSSPIIIVQSGVKTFQLINDVIWYAKGNQISSRTVTGSEMSQTLSLPTTETVLSLSTLRDKKTLFVRTQHQSFLIDTSNPSLISIPSDIELPQNIAVTPDGKIILLQQNNLVVFDPIKKLTTALQPNILAFTILGQTAYLVTTDRNLVSAIWNGQNLVDEQSIANFNINIPNPKTVSLIITDRKELFLNLASGGLYKIGQNLDTVSPRVDSVNFELSTNELTFTTSGELWFYNFLTNQAQLLTRSTINTNSFIIHSNIGYGFVGNQNGLDAIEIDTRDEQNRYSLIKNLPVWQTAMTANQKILIALQGDALVYIAIRN